jgi:hypothetical protein
VKVAIGAIAGCNKAVFVGDTIWCYRSKSAYIAPINIWYPVVLRNSEYRFCGHCPFGHETIICRECAVLAGLAW